MDLEKKNKAIEKMAEAILKEITPLQETYSNTYLAELLYNAGYRKQTEAEWVPITQFVPQFGCEFILQYRCSNCLRQSDNETDYCPGCGARMKGK